MMRILLLRSERLRKGSYVHYIFSSRQRLDGKPACHDLRSAVENEILMLHIHVWKICFVLQSCISRFHPSPLQVPTPLECIALKTERKRNAELRTARQCRHSAHFLLLHTPQGMLIFSIRQLGSRPRKVRRGTSPSLPAGTPREKSEAWVDGKRVWHIVVSPLICSACSLRALKTLCTVVVQSA